MLEQSDAAVNRLSQSVSSKASTIIRQARQCTMEIDSYYGKHGVQLLVDIAPLSKTRKTHNETQLK